MIGGFGMPELMVVLGIAVLIFGAKRIPEIARSMGKAVNEFKKAGKEIREGIEEAADEDSGGDASSKDA